VFTIRIQAGKNDPQKKKKLNEFHVLCWIFSLEGWRLLLFLGRSGMEAFVNKYIAIF
jgi:hypothetical protein